MVALAAALLLAQTPNALTISEDAYVLKVVPDADRRGATAVLTGPGTDNTAPPEMAWKIHLGFLPRAAKINGLGRTVLFGDEAHAVVVVDDKGKTADHPLSEFLKGEALATARGRLVRGQDPFDTTDYEYGALRGSKFDFDDLKGVTLKRMPKYEGFAIWQGTVWCLDGRSVFYVRVGKAAYAWFDPVDGELLSTDVPNADARLGTAGSPGGAPPASGPGS